MSTGEDLLMQYQGEIVPRSFRPGFVVLSYVVSCIGAALTLELLNRRTSRNGLFNHLILVSAAVAMGGISIWCMHFVGNRAIVLANDEPELRIDYSGSFSALSFFLPIVVLLTAFVATGASYKVSWWRICCGGLLAGCAICGMHYLANASISNYHCIYDNAHIAAAALIAIFDSVVALSLFFVFRASWKNSWWKRMLSAFLLAGAVSGMHWAAATGTDYRLTQLNKHTALSQTQATVVVTCLVVVTAFFIAGSATYASWAKQRIANKAQQVVLAAAIFDSLGRVLVNPDGLLPNEKITDTYVERTREDTFDIAHPLFHWMFQVSRNWNSVSSMINGMTNHLARLPKESHDSKIRLIEDNGQLIENYDTVFRELFCIAAASLADKLREQLVNVGILWDEILFTGVDGLPRKHGRSIARKLEEGTYGVLGSDSEKRIGRQHEYGRGALMFLVRRLENPYEIERLEAAGFRFADVHQVCGIIGSRMQIKARDLKGKLSNMATYAEENTIMEPGVHLGFFGVKARVGSYGFDVVVKKGARNLLPTMPISTGRLDSWQMNIIRQFDRMNVPLLLQGLDALKKLSPREVLFASQLTDALQALRAWIDDPIFEESVLVSRVVQAPCHAPDGSTLTKACTVIALCLMMPIHVRFSSPRCESIPLTFFKVHQMVYKNSSELEAFTRYVHRELSPVVNTASVNAPQATCQQAMFWKNRPDLLRYFGRSKTKSGAAVRDSGSIPINPSRMSSSHESNHSGSTMKLWSQDFGDGQQSCNETISDRTIATQPSSLGGIMVSQEIQIDIRQVDDTGGGPSVPLKIARDRVTIVKAGTDFDFEMKSLLGPGLGEDTMYSGQPLGLAVAEREKVNEVITFVDELFAFCVDGL